MSRTIRSRTIRAAATALATAIVASSLLAAPLLAAKGGAGGGGTTTTTLSATATATPAYTIIVGAITKVTFKYSWQNGLNRTLRLVVPAGYAKPQMEDPFSPATGAGAGYVVQAASTTTACPTALLSVADSSISVSTGECSTGTFWFDYYAQASATGAAKFAVYADLGTVLSTTALTTLTLNAASAKVSITSITYTDGTALGEVQAGDVIRANIKVTDSKNRATLIGVPLTITDSNAGAEWVGGQPSCPISTPWVVCSSSTGTAWADILVTGANQHQIRAAIGSYSGQRSFTAAAGALVGYAATLEGASELTAGTSSFIAISGVDAYENQVAVDPADIDAAQSAGDGEVTVTLPTDVDANGVARIEVAGLHVGFATVDYTAGAAVLEGSEDFTVIAADLDHLTITPSTMTELTAGTSQDFDVAGFDAYENAIPLTTGQVDWTTGAGDAGSLTWTEATDETEADGVVTLSPTGIGAGALTLTASVGAFTADAAVTVVPAAIDSITLTSSETGDLTAGVTRTFTISALDAFGNPVDLAAGDVDWITGGSDTGTVTWTEATDESDAAGDGTVSLTVTGDLTGGVTIEASAGGLTETSSFIVVAGAIASLTLTPSATGNLTAGDTRSFTVTAADAMGNPISLAADDVDWTTGAGEEAFVSYGADVDAAGDGTVSLIVTGELTGGVTLYAAVGGVSANASFTVEAGAYAHLVITGDDADLLTGTTRTLTIVATDAKGNVLSLAGLGLSLSVTSNDPTVLTAGTVNGDGTFEVSAGTAGMTWLSASDGTVISDPFTLTVPAPTED